VKRASSYAERLHLAIAVIHGEEKGVDGDGDDGRTSPPLLDGDESTSGSSISRMTSVDVHNLPGSMLLSSNTR